MAMKMTNKMHYVG